MGVPAEAISAWSYGLDPVAILGWFVCPTVTMVTTIKAAGLEKTLKVIN